MSNYVEQHISEMLVCDMLEDILADQFSSECDTLFDRDASQKSGPTGDHVEGIYLPDPERYFRQSGPSTGQENTVGKVSAYIGPISPAEPIDPTRAESTVADGFVFQCSQLFAVTFVFGRAAQTLPLVNGRKLAEEEAIRYRASYYAGAIAHTIFKHAGGSNVIWGTRPGQRSSEAVQIQISAKQYKLIGVAAYEFTVINNQLFPKFSNY